MPQSSFISRAEHVIGVTIGQMITIAGWAIMLSGTALILIVVPTLVALAAACDQARWFAAAVEGDTGAGVKCVLTAAFFKIAAYCVCGLPGVLAVKNTCDSCGVRPHANVWAGAALAGAGAGAFLEFVWFVMLVVGLSLGFTRAAFITATFANGINALTAASVFGYGVWVNCDNVYAPAAPSSSVPAAPSSSAPDRKNK